MSCWNCVSAAPYASDAQVQEAPGALPTPTIIASAARCESTAPVRAAGRSSARSCTIYRATTPSYPASLVDAVIAGDRAELARWGNPLKVVSEISRAALCADPGHILICVDLGCHRIARSPPGSPAKCGSWRTSVNSMRPATRTSISTACSPHRMLNKDSPVSEITTAERQLGKCAELACGFGGRSAPGDASPATTVAAMQRSSHHRTVARAHPAIRAFWHELAQAARVAIRTGQPILVAAAPRPPIIVAFDGYALTHHAAERPRDQLSRARSHPQRQV